MADLLEPGTVIKPQMDKNKAIKLALDLYGLKATNVKEFNSYDDRNYFFKIDIETGIDNDNISKEDIFPEGYILKVTNSLDSKDMNSTVGQNEMILHMAKCNMDVPMPIKNKNGDYVSLEKFEFSNESDQWQANNEDKTTEYKEHLVRILKFIPGKILYDVDPWLPRHFFEAGKFAAEMDEALKDFNHPAYDKKNLIWFLSSIPQVKNFLHAITDEQRSSMCKDIFDEFSDKVMSIKESLETGIIHGDFNEQNILVRPLKNDPEQYEIFGVIDFGDSQKNPYIFELAITIMYMMTKCEVIDPNEVGGKSFFFLLS